MVDIVEKITDFANFRNLFIIAIVISVVGFMLNSSAFAISGSQLSLVMMVFCAAAVGFWVMMMRNSRNILYRDAIMGEPMSTRALDAQYDGRKRYTMFEKDMVTWQWEGEKDVMHAAKVIEVKLSKLTAHDMNEAELARMTRDYEGIMNTGDVEIVTVHARKKVQSKDWISKLERRRDNLEFDAQLGGRATHGEKALQITSTLQRVKNNLENVYDSRFFIIIAATAPTMERVKEELKINVNSILERLRDQLKLEVAVVKDNRLLEATNFFRIYTTLGHPRGTVDFFKPFRTLSFDLGWHTPFAVPRLPPLSKLIKGIYIGTVTTTGQPVHWDPEDPEMSSPHTLFIGPTGSGKTTAARTFLVRAMQAGIPYWVIDPAGDYTDFTRKQGGVIVNFREVTVNPFVLYDRNPTSVAKEIVDMTTLVTGLQGAERFFLQEQIMKAFTEVGVDVSKPETWTDERSNRVNFVMLYKRIVKRFEANDFGPADSLLARGVMQKIQDISTGSYALREQNLNLDDLFKQKIPICFYVHEALGESLRKMLAWTLIGQLRALMFTRYNIAETLRLFLAVDEAHHFVKAMLHPSLPGGRIDTPLTAFIREMRKKGVACWMFSQDPQDFMNPGERTSPIFLNVGTLLMMGKADQAYMDFVTHYMGLTQEDAWGPNGLYWMTRHGQGILKKSNDPRPIPIQVEAAPEALTGKG